MKRYIFLILLICMVGCGENEGSVTFSDNTVVSSWLDDLTVRMYIENNTDLPIMSSFEVDIHDDWLVNQINGERTVYENYALEVEETDTFRLDHRSENIYTISYALENKVDKIQFIEAIDQGAIEVTLRSEDGEELASKVITNVHIYDSNNIGSSGMGMLFIVIIASVLGAILLEKFIRKWTGIRKPEREELPKLYKTLNMILHIITGLYLTFALRSIGPTELWETIILFVLLYGVLQVVLDFILIKHQKEYRVTLLSFAVILTVVVVIAERYPYMFF
ncbi:hypothetical protein ACTWQB_13310 [Piscibacillus sp. B03]|uniref:hypothetical protein n=1 Tax=Piscibacillus sp. B03 TaxID=3457430 RepID=UPI003FCE8ACE